MLCSTIGTLEPFYAVKFHIWNIIGMPNNTITVPFGQLIWQQVPYKSAFSSFSYLLNIQRTTVQQAGHRAASGTVT